MGFKMKGFNAGKGTRSSKGFPSTNVISPPGTVKTIPGYPGEYVTQPDGSVIWQNTQE